MPLTLIPALDTERIADVLACRATQPDTDSKEAQRLNNAEHALAKGLELRETINGWLVPSRDPGRGGDVYRVVVHRDPHTGDGWCECSCPRGLTGQRCWHVALVEVVESVREMYSEVAVCPV